ncbi:MAG: phage baseplate assembly protein V [Roseburia sp.]|nr:phage baseplate assembly protein V [Roseburia sp.]
MAADLTQNIVENGLDSVGRYYSIYRGVVMDTDDPQQMNRIKVFVPNLDILEWALPRGQHGSTNSGFRLCPLPNFNDIVYVTFVNGNPGEPLWEYHGWGDKQMPDEFLDENVCGLITPGGTKVLVDDANGLIYINTLKDLVIKVESGDGNGIILNADNIRLLANDTTIINDGKEGVPNIVDLTTKLNKLVQEVEQLRTLYNTHVHPGVVAGPGSSGPTTSQVATPISQFNKEDYEDKTFLH